MTHADPEDLLVAHDVVMRASLRDEVSMVLETASPRLAFVHARGSFRVVEVSPVLVRVFFDTAGDHNEQRDALREAVEVLNRSGFDAGICSYDGCVTVSPREEQERMDVAA